jgi:membrane fusion protein (multidrug efflux system)
MNTPPTVAQADAQADAVVIPLADSKTSRKRMLLRGGMLVATLAAAGYGYHWWNEGRFLQETDDAYVGGNITVVAPKVPGYLAEVAVQDNQQVHAGDVLARIDDRDYRAALAKAEGAVAAAHATIANLDATRELQDAVIAQARAGVSANKAETTRARDDQQRYISLSAKSAVSVQSSQKAEADYQQAIANGQKSDAQLAAAQREQAVIGTRKQQAEAALAQAVAERDLAKLNLEYTVLRAPLDGAIGNRRARAGAYATVGNQLLSIVPAHGLWVDANYKEGQLAKFKPGQRASVVADIEPGRVFHGTVASLAPATGAQFSILPAENATGNFTKIVQRVPVRIVLDDKDAALGTLRPGLSVTAEVDTRIAQRAQ